MAYAESEACGRVVAMQTFEAPSQELDAYLVAVDAWPAGEVALAPHEDSGMAQLLLLRAARILRLRVVTSWRDGGRVLQWARAS